MSHPKTEFKLGNPGGPGRPPGSPNKSTRDFKEAQGKLQKLIDAELYRDEEAPELTRRTKIQAIVAKYVARALAGDYQATQLILERWAGKAVLVVEEKATVEPVDMVFDAPRPDRSAPAPKVDRVQ